MLLMTNIPVVIQELYSISSGGVVGIAARGQIYMSVPLGVVEIHLRAKLPRNPKQISAFPNQTEKKVSNSHLERVLFNDTLNTFYLRLYGVRHGKRSQREETRCRHLGYSFRLAATALLYA